MDVVKLIRGVKSRQPLWDRKHTYYHDRNVTMGLWDDVADSLGADPDSVRLKWKGLRDTFRGELKKLHKGAVNGKAKKSTNWEYFDEMLFVKDQIYSTKHLNDLKNSNNLEIKKEEKDEEEEKTTKLTTGTTTITTLTTQEDQEMAYYPVMEEDDDYNFLMSVLPQLRCLPTTRNLYIRLKIQELLYNEIIALQTM